MYEFDCIKEYLIHETETLLNCVYFEQKSWCLDREKILYVTTFEQKLGQRKH